MRPKKVIKFEAHYNNGILKEKGKYKLHDFPAIKGGCTQGVPAFTGYAKFGKWTEYYENGNKKSITIYREGKYEKIKKLWEEDGTKIEVIPEEE
jgi:antitoxin component YwqK of YwqJK toxin-antitoxin module